MEPYAPGFTEKLLRMANRFLFLHSQELKMFPFSPIISTINYLLD